MVGSTARYLLRILLPFRHIEGVSGWFNVIPYAGAVVTFSAGSLLHLPLAWLIVAVLVVALAHLVATGVGLQSELDRRVSDVRQTIQFLEKKVCLVAGTEHPLREIVYRLRQHFLLGIREDVMQRRILDVFGFDSDSLKLRIDVDSLLANLILAQVLEREYIQPPVDQTSGRGSLLKSFHSAPYTVCRLNDLGKRVIQQLEHD